jgi:hypothetical protein
MTGRLLPASAATLVLIVAAGCATQSPIAAGPCNAGVCKVTVQVLDCTRKDGFVASPDLLAVNASNRIEWDLITPGYRFAADGIDIKKNDGVFEDPKVIGNGTKFSWKDRHASAPGYAPRVYDYVINVVSQDGAVRCGAFDPRISNI